MQNGHDRMLITQCSDRAQVHDLADSMCSGKMVPLRVPQAVHIEHHLCQQPVVLLIVRRIYKLRALYVRLYGEGQEVMGYRVDVKVRLTGGSILAGRHKLGLLVKKVGKK